MEYQTLQVVDEGTVRIVELNRPEALNAFSAQMMDDVADAFLDSRDDDAVKVLVMTGAGRAFSAGADLMEMGRPQTPPKHGLGGMLDAIVDFPKPFIVAVNGLGVGIGATICGLADFAFMADEARLRCPFSALGLTAEAGSTYMLPRLMGRQQASWFLMAAEWMNGPECARTGLVMESMPLQELMATVRARAEVLAALPLASLTTTKALIMDPLRPQLRASIKAENKGLAELVGGAANKEALAAFREKREADFSRL